MEDRLFPNASSKAPPIASRYGYGIDPDYLRIGADAIQLFSLVKAARDNRRAAGANCFAAGTLVDTATGETPIEQLHVGQRVLTQVDNPFAKGEPINAEGDPNSTQVDPSTWREVDLDMPDPANPGNDYTMQLLEPLSWIRQNAARAGSSIYLDLPELQIHGNAIVQSINACPSIQSGQGRVLIGTFQHVSHNIVDIKLVGDDKPVEVTAGHKLWSLDRGDWVQAADLNPGERLATEHGQAVVDSVVATSIVERVYNLDVEVDHRYFVGSDALLAHNATPCLPPHVIVEEDGVLIDHNYASGDHGPPHLHVEGNGPSTRIGMNGKPLDGDPELSSAQQAVVDAHLKEIRKAVAQIGKWYRANNPDLYPPNQ